MPRVPGAGPQPGLAPKSGRGHQLPVSLRSRGLDTPPANSTLPTMAIDLVSMAALINALVDLARRPIVLAATILAFVATSIVCLVLSGVLFSGWWESFFQGVGVSLLFVGVVNLGILGALRGLIEGPSRDTLSPEEAQQLRDAVERLERKLAELS
jgi:hypothetical protein